MFIDDIEVRNNPQIVAFKRNPVRVRTLVRLAPLDECKGVGGDQLLQLPSGPCEFSVLQANRKGCPITTANTATILDGQLTPRDVIRGSLSLVDLSTLPVRLVFDGGSVSALYRFPGFDSSLELREMVFRPINFCPNAYERGRAVEDDGRGHDGGILPHG